MIDTDEALMVHETGKCPVCKRGNIGFFTDEIGTLRQCWDCGSEWNDSMEITICSHVDYSMTMTGFVCNTCGKGEEE